MSETNTIFPILSCEFFSAIYSQLQSLQYEFISFEDLVDLMKEIISWSTIRLSEKEFFAYCGIIYEIALTPVYSDSFGAKLVMKNYILQSEAIYFDAVLKNLREKKESMVSSVKLIVEPYWIRFLRETEEYLRPQQTVPSKMLHQPTNQEVISSPRNPLPNDIHSSEGTRFFQQPENPGLLPTAPQPIVMLRSRKFNPMKDEGVIQILAYVRNGGMDIFFPPLLQEKVKDC
jgi:hypothetical protein